jgi:hypothetical protein
VQLNLFKRRNCSALLYTEEEKSSVKYCKTPNQAACLATEVSIIKRKGIPSIIINQISVKIYSQVNNKDIFLQENFVTLAAIARWNVR